MVAEKIAAACTTVLSCALVLFATHGPARSEDRPDTSLVYRWSAVYRSRVDLDRASFAFPWNDDEEYSHLNDRLAILGELDLARDASLFAKGATGFRLGGGHQDEQFILDQAHVGFDLLGRHWL